MPSPGISAKLPNKSPAPVSYEHSQSVEYAIAVLAAIVPELISVKVKVFAPVLVTV
jgi:hypothetical protein